MIYKYYVHMHMTQILSTFLLYCMVGGPSHTKIQIETAGESETKPDQSQSFEKCDCGRSSTDAIFSHSSSGKTSVNATRRRSLPGQASLYLPLSRLCLLPTTVWRALFWSVIMTTNNIALVLDSRWLIVISADRMLSLGSLGSDGIHYRILLI